MGNPFREIVLRGAISLTLCALATLLVFELLSVLAEHLPSKARIAVLRSVSGRDTLIVSLQTMIV
jgi:hypothetical protein